MIQKPDRKTPDPWNQNQNQNRNNKIDKRMDHFGEERCRVDNSDEENRNN
jgi:hypothetical protein